MAAIGQLPPVEGRTPRDLRMRARIRAPEARRIAVNVAASIAVSRNAILHSRELLAKASMASEMRRAVRRLVAGTIILQHGIARAMAWRGGFDHIQSITRYQALNYDHVRNV